MTGIPIFSGYPAFNLIKRIEKEAGQVFSGRLDSTEWSFIKGMEKLNLTYIKEIEINYTVDAVVKKEKGIIIVPLN